MTSTPLYFIPLKSRQLIKVTGEDRRSFLQGLITNDIDLLGNGSVMLYACMLTPQGKFLYEFFIFEDGDVTYLDTEASRAEECLKRLTMYKLRAKVELSLDDTLKCYVGSSDTKTDDGFQFADPRHEDAGQRYYLTDFNNEAKGTFDTYDQHRISLGLLDGSRDMEPERTTMAEARMDAHNGVSYTKGCYVGQEITARMHHRGLVKKELLPLERLDDTSWEVGEKISLDGKEIGHITSHCGSYAIAQIKCDAKDALDQQSTLKLLL